MEIFQKSKLENNISNLSEKSLDKKSRNSYENRKTDIREKCSCLFLTRRRWQLRIWKNYL